MRRTPRRNGILCLVFCVYLCSVGTAEERASLPPYIDEIAERLFSPELVLFDAGILRGEGYDVNGITVNDTKALERATQDTNFVVRLAGLTVLAYNGRHQTIPTLRHSLDDVHPSVRCTAAKLLGALGDPSGLARLRSDLSEFTKGDGTGDPGDASSADQKARQHSASKNLRLALEAVEVLAMFGDCSGYDLAARTALDSTAGGISRLTAIKALGELGRVDKGTLTALGCDPEPVFLSVAGSEKSPFMLNTLVSIVMTTMRPESAIKILEQAHRSPHVSDSYRRTLERFLETSRKRLAEEQQVQDTTKSTESRR